MIESPVARVVCVYWIIVILAWWYPGFYRLRLGRHKEIGRSWRASEEYFSERVRGDLERANVSYNGFLIGMRITLSIGWPFVMVWYFKNLVQKFWRLYRLRRARRGGG